VRGSQDTARLVAVAAVVLGALGLVSLAARSERTATVTAIATVARTPEVGEGPTLPSLSATATEAEEDPRDSTLPGYLLWMGAAIFAAPLVLLLFFLPAVTWLPRLRMRLRRRGRADDARPPPVEDEVPAARLAAAVDEGLRELDQGGPGDGVLASWVLLERAAAEAGTHRAAPDTPSELAARLLDRHSVSSGPLLRLADLYREARFSRHEVPEAARAEARAALEQLRAELAADPIGGRR
jgi:uncharacterized protein DUF4129